VTFLFICVPLALALFVGDYSIDELTSVSCYAGHVGAVLTSDHG